MRSREKRSAGRGRGWLLAAAAIAAFVGLGRWPQLEAAPARVAELSAILRHPAGEGRKAMAIEELRKIDASEARQELASLADSKDDRLAMLAIRALGRLGTTGAKAKVAGVVESTSRSPLVRETALAVWCQMQADGEKSFADGKAWARQKIGNNARLAAQLAACKTRHWPNEIDGVSDDR